MLKKFGFQSKLTVGFSLLSITSAAIFGVVTYRLSSQTAYDLLNKDLESQLKGVHSSIQVSLESNLERQNQLMDYWFPVATTQIEIDPSQTTPKQVVNQVTKEKVEVDLPSVFVKQRPLADDSFVDEIAGQSQDAVTVFAATDQGLVRVTTSVKDKEGKRATGTFIPKESPVYKELATGKRFSGRAQVVGEWYVTSYQPILKNNKMVGAFFMGTPETSYHKIKAFLKTKKILATGYFFILDSKGKFVLHPSKEGEDSLATADLDGKEIFKEILENKNGRLEYRWMNAETKSAQNKGAIYTYFPEMDWYVAASFNAEEAYESVAKLERFSWMLGLANVGGMILATLAFGIPMSRRLKRIGHAVNEASVDGLSGAHQLQAASSSVAESSVEQAASLQQTVSALDEIRAMVERNLSSTESATDVSSQMAAKAEKGKNALSQLNSSMQTIASGNEDLRQEVEKSFVDFENINKMIVEIRKRTEVINEIVFQTKLISLNASVEAARAGEHGRGFSVVAEEVGRLARMSGEAAGEIEINLSKTIDSVGEIIAKTKKNVGQVVQVSSASISSGVSGALACQTLLQEIVAEIHQAKDLVNEIASASKEQSTGIAEIASAMHELDKATQQNSMSAQRVNTLADTSEKNAQSLRIASDSLREFLGSAPSDVPVAPDSQTPYGSPAKTVTQLPPRMPKAG